MKGEGMTNPHEEWIPSQIEYSYLARLLRAMWIHSQVRPEQDEKARLKTQGYQVAIQFLSTVFGVDLD